jgi:acetolactate synthase-1/2/3 large subunit
MKNTMRVADYIFKRLEELTESRHCYLLSGGGAMHLVDALGKSKIKPVPMHHEQAAVIAADASGRVNNTLGLALVTTGPGGTNAVTPVTGSWMDSTPLLVISGQVSRANWKWDSQVRQMGIQEADIVPIVKSVTKYAEMVMAPEDIRYHLEKAVHLATTGRPGPVWLDIPLDVQAAKIDAGTLRAYNPSEKRIEADTDLELESKIEKLIDLIGKSKRPLLVGGHGVKLSGAEEEFRKLAEKMNIPVQNTWNAIDLIEESHPLYFGRANVFGPRYANFIIQNCDLLISIGARLGIQHIGYNHKAFAREAVKVMVDADQGEIFKHTLKIDLPVVSDAKRFIRKFSEKLTSSGENTERLEWTEWCAERKKRYPVITDAHLKDDFVDPYVFCDRLSDHCDEKMMIVPGSSGTGFTAVHQTFRMKKGQKFISSKGLSSMGYGLPSSIGGCFASGKRKTVTIIGDGGLQLNIQELATISHNRLPIKIFIFNNSGYLSIRMTQKTFFGGHFVGSDPSSGVWFPSLEKLAAAYEMRYEKIRNHAELDENIKTVMDGDDPVLCEVMMDAEKAPLPKLGSRQKADGTMESNPLEDLVPLLPRDEFSGNMIIKQWEG